MAKRKVIEVEANGKTYDEVCEHGVHFGGCNCWVCHPEKLSSVAWLFSPEMDAAYAAEKSTQQAVAADQPIMRDFGAPVPDPWDEAFEEAEV